MGPSQYSAWYWSALYNHQLYLKSSIFKYSGNYSVIYLSLFSSFHVVFLPELSVALFSFSSQVFRFQRTWGEFGCGLLFLFFYWANFLVIFVSVFFSFFISWASKLAVSYSFIYFLHLFINFHFPFCFFCFVPLLFRKYIFSLFNSLEINVAVQAKRNNTEIKVVFNRIVTATAISEGVCDEKCEDAWKWSFPGFFSILCRRTVGIVFNQV